MKSDQKAREIISLVMSIPLEKIDGTIRIGITKQWDSIAHMNLILSIEQEVGRFLQPSEYLDVEDFDSLKLFLDKHSP